ncbi:MAG TPA: GAF domain-containing protein [Caulobacteraceae bacterium]|jgi:GAF domain-containing protein
MRATVQISSGGETLAERYARLAEEIDAVVDGETSLTARMATVAAMLAEAFERFFWTGFYVVDPARGDQLVVGPYQGSLGCLRIDFARGVCGAAATRLQTVIVDDVDAFPGHVACDSRSRSEIVVPVFDAQSRLIAVLDVDSTAPAAFSGADALGLEDIVRRVFAG